MVEPDRSRMAIWCMRISYFITKATNTHEICSTYCFATEKMVTRTSLIVNVVPTLPVMFYNAFILFHTLFALYRVFFVTTVDCQFLCAPDL